MDAKLSTNEKAIVGALGLGVTLRSAARLAIDRGRMALAFAGRIGFAAVPLIGALHWHNRPAAARAPGLRIAARSPQ